MPVLSALAVRAMLILVVTADLAGQPGQELTGRAVRMFRVSGSPASGGVPRPGGTVLAMVSELARASNRVRGWPQRARVGDQLKRRTAAAGEPSGDERPPRLDRVQRGGQDSGVVPFRRPAEAGVGYRDYPVPGRDAATAADRRVTAHNPYILSGLRRLGPRYRRSGHRSTSPLISVVVAPATQTVPSVSSREM